MTTLLLQQVQRPGFGHGLDTIVHPQLPIDVGDVPLDGADRDGRSRQVPASYRARLPPITVRP